MIDNHGMQARFIALLLASCLTGCGDAAPCSSHVVEVACDPKSDRYAATESRNCGATTGYATVVRVGLATEYQNNATEVFVADSDHGVATEGPGDTVWTDVRWTAPGQLFIAYASHARVFKRAAAAKDADIRYRATDRISPMPPS
jgi:hypothetical protein